MAATLFQVLDALEVASKAHEGQVYHLSDGVEPYINHPVRLAMKFADPVLQKIALLHDTVEDTKLTLDEIREQFGDRVADGVDFLTRRPGELYLSRYIPRLMKNADAVEVKLADLDDNMTHGRMDPERYHSLLVRYERARQLILKLKVAQTIDPPLVVN
jgi:(p)ppGpp synthase/HD superfamily hydrolase